MGLELTTYQFIKIMKEETYNKDFFIWDDDDKKLISIGTPIYYSFSREFREYHDTIEFENFSVTISMNTPTSQVIMVPKNKEDTRNYLLCIKITDN